MIVRYQQAELSLASSIGCTNNGPGQTSGLQIIFNYYIEFYPVDGLTDGTNDRLSDILISRSHKDRSDIFYD